MSEQATEYRMRRSVAESLRATAAKLVEVAKMLDAGCDYDCAAFTVNALARAARADGRRLGAWSAMWNGLLGLYRDAEEATTPTSDAPPPVPAATQPAPRAGVQ